MSAQYVHRHGLATPIRRLPVEIIAEIFGLSMAVSEQDYIGHRTYPAIALNRLAHLSLLKVSQVCARWHSIAMGTPSLWTKIHLDTALWRSPITTSKAMGLLQSTLARGGHCPLTVLVTNAADWPSHGPALKLLARHSTRWRAATFRCRYSDLRHLSSIKGNLPILETLVAPRLRDLAITGALGPHVSTPPLAQVSKVRCLDLASTDIAAAVSTMSHLSGANNFSLQFYLDDGTSNEPHNLDLAIRHTSSNVGHLAIELLGEFFRNQCKQALGSIFAGLTLPRLEGLTFDSEKYPPFRLSRPPPIAMLVPCAYNGGAASLLPALPARIDDPRNCRPRAHPRAWSNLELITDTLLVALTKTSNARCLIPRLDTLSLRSRLQFDDSVYLDLVLSRLQPERKFTSVLGILPHWTEGREIDNAVVARLREMVVQGDLILSLPGSQ
ncbi:hypothetical protein B0H13DRAFT_2335699 [Mycena leptocephala]|nr:hypothetical protein B0H13DRAFT_2335699 [Mycena leptocephala]